MLLIGIAVMDGFDMGVGIFYPLLPVVGRSDLERRVVINSVRGPVWEGNQVWLILGGGAIFAAFPPLYGVAFSGFYLAMLLLLCALILRPVALTFRGKINSSAWRRGWDIVFFVSGLVPSLVFGVAFGNLLLGTPFHFDNGLQLEYEGDLLGLLNPFALLCGAVSVAMLTMQGASFLASKSEGEVARRAGWFGAVAALILVLLLSAAGAWVALRMDGLVLRGDIDPAGPSNPLWKSVAKEAGGWLNNFRHAPLSLAAPIFAYLGALGAAIALATGAARIRARFEQRGGRRGDRDRGLQPVPVPAAVVDPSRPQPDGLGRFVQPDDPVAHACRDPVLSPDRARLHKLGVLYFARPGQRGRDRARRRLSLLNRRERVDVVFFLDFGAGPRLRLRDSQRDVARARGTQRRKEIDGEARADQKTGAVADRRVALDRGRGARAGGAGIFAARRRRRGDKKFPHPRRTRSRDAARHRLERGSGGRCRSL